MPASPERTSFSLRPRGAFSLARTADRLVRFADIVDRFEDGTYWRLLDTDGALVRVRVTQQGPPSRALLRVRLDGKGARSAAASTAARRVLAVGLGSEVDVRPFYARFRDDPLLGTAIAHHRGLRVAGAPTLWESLVTTVLSQQVNLEFAYAIRSDLARAFGRRARFDGQTLIAFPRPERVARETEARLREFRLSGAKAGTILRLARAFADGSLDALDLEQRSDEDVVEALTSWKGIGRWTAEVALMRGLARPDAFPAGDLGIVKRLATLIRGKPASEAQMRRMSAAWRPHRSLALVYLYAEIGRRAAL